MRFYKVIINGYITRIGIGDGYEEITEQEYNSLFDIIHSKPIAESGYGYKLKDNLTWELYEIPKVEEEITEEEYAEKVKAEERVGEK